MSFDLKYLYELPENSEGILLPHNQGCTAGAE